MISPLLLKNSTSGIDKNACFANSVINILRRITLVRNILPALTNESRIHFLLQNIFAKEGSIESQSCSDLRQELDRRKGTVNFSSGVQNDSKEFLDALLETLPSLADIFKFTITRKYSFINSKFSPKCQYCNQEENPVSSQDSTIHLHLLPSNNMALQILIDNYFKFQAGYKKCSKMQCQNTQNQVYNETTTLTEAGPYIFIQLLRFDNYLQKIDAFVQGSFKVQIGNFEFKLISVINHLGTFNNGHYISLLEHHEKWYICNDDQMPQEIPSEAVFSKANYMYVFEK